MADEYFLSGPYGRSRHRVLRIIILQDIPYRRNSRRIGLAGKGLVPTPVGDDLKVISAGINCICRITTVTKHILRIDHVQMNLMTSKRLWYLVMWSLLRCQ